MKRTSHTYIMLAAFAALTLLSGCKSEKKASYYSNIYSEKPTLIYIAPVQDNSERKIEKYPKDIAYNVEVNSAKNYMHQTLAAPLLNHGYYVIGPVASEQIAATETRELKQLRHSDLSRYYKDYSIDAVLLTTIHRWVEKNGEWTVYLEYLLRSSKTGADLMHRWVVASKVIPTDLKRDPRPLKEDRRYAKEMNIDNGTAQRCFLIERVNDYVMRNIPLSSTMRQYEEDLYKSANPTYTRYTWNEEGKADVEPCTLEEYEQECFL
ncbi:MAG: hypothetical protein IJV22_07495 [Bacteroidales bacterium]|nr:hypothetical protein [Bacteroidales bacterium]